MEFIAHNLAPIMFAGLICFLLVGFPVAFSLGACGLFFAFIGIEMNVLPEALLQGEHVKVDVISSRFSKRTQIWIDVFGYIVFLTPMCLAVLWYGVPFFTRALASGEMSNNAGGLIRWPAYLMMPLGFTLLWLQGISELIKRLGFLQGLIEDPTVKKAEKTAEEELAESIRNLAEAAKGNGKNKAEAH